MTEFNDEYFLNLTMKYDERIDDIYCHWAVWCANSDDKYYIDGKDGHFYTHIRTPEEIAKEQMKRKVQDFIMQERMEAGEFDEAKEEQFRQYEEYYRELAERGEAVEMPKHFADWSSES